MLPYCRRRERKLRGKGGGMRGFEGLSIQRRAREQGGKVRMGEVDASIVDCTRRVENTVARL